MGELRPSGWYPDQDDRPLHARRAARRQSKKARPWGIAGLIVCAVIIAWVAWACASSYSPYQSECRSSLTFGTGKQGKDLDDLVKICVDLNERGTK
ncbi:hypothetical protein [Mycolicibacterium sphagni]|uniref:Uncharacterized protein n=1 Tax=Mycolicibacterium sphagni TaxID=1786 RepID=A0A255DMT2_9MYCO|nr:hypothetical protein [Mycolicibacterium sphagni]MCV7179821.1 hypothetical protein [Mycolicibacterium sphagni]OYN80656.1 hypothetical protein CG716_07270 [Mycolicibacterium sphagni]